MLAKNLSIHPNGRAAARKGTGTKPPRTRSNINTDPNRHPHNAYPGGKKLRKASLKLARRRDCFDNLAVVEQTSFTRPGSMSK